MLLVKIFLFAANGNKTASNERFGAMSALPRRQFCANGNVIPPRKVQWKPPLRQAAGTLYARRESAYLIGKSRNKIVSLQKSFR
jgi:hypothetical protein